MWEENNISLQVVFEILSPGNTPKEMAKKLAFYEKHCVSEYGEDMQGWISPLLKIRFERG